MTRGSTIAGSTEVHVEDTSTRETGSFVLLLLSGVAAYLYVSLFFLPSTPFLLGGDQVFFWLPGMRMLDHARIYARGGDLAEGSRCPVWKAEDRALAGVGIGELRVVEDVEEFTPNLDGHRFVDDGPLRKPEIGIVETRTVEEPAVGRPKSTQNGVLGERACQKIAARVGIGDGNVDPGGFESGFGVRQVRFRFPARCRGHGGRCSLACAAYPPLECALGLAGPVRGFGFGRRDGEDGDGGEVGAVEPWDP